MSLQPPSIPDYSFPGQALIGEGAYGWVWLGLFKGDQPRAVKVFKPRAIQEELWRGEYEKLRALDEPPGVVTLYDAGHTDDEQPYVAMRLMADRLPQGKGWQGRTLSRALDDGRLTMSEGWRLLREIAETLAFVHHNQVRHCDLKPGNVLLSSGDEPRPVLCDFGQSRRAGDASERAMAPGTALYASPEQLRQPDQPRKSWDVYSFGVTAYRVLMGRLPRLQSLVEEVVGNDDALQSLDQTLVSQRSFETGLAASSQAILPSPEILAGQVESEAADGPPLRPAGLTPELRDAFRIVERCLAVEGQHPPRYADMQEVEAALKQADDRRLIAAERRKKMVFAALTAFGLSAAAFAGWKGWMAARAQGDTEIALTRMEEARDESQRYLAVALVAQQEAEASRVEADRQRAAAEFEAQRARDSERRTLESEALSQHARGAAEKIINRMLYDLRADLEKVGRVDLLEDVSREAESYFANLPIAFRTEATERELSTMLNNRGDVFLAQGDPQAALEMYQRGLELRRERLTADDSDTSRVNDLAVSLERVGDAWSGLGRYGEAETAYEECLGIRRGAASTEPDSATAADRGGDPERELGVALTKLGDLHLAQQRFAEAEPFYTEALEIFGKLAAEPGTLNGIDLGLIRQRDLSAARLRMGDLLLQSQRGEMAREHYEQSLAGLRDLESKAPQDLSLPRDISAVAARLGDLLGASGEAKQATAAYEEACAALARLVDRDPLQESWQVALAAMLGNAGDTANEHDPQAADEFFRAAEKHYVKLTGSEPAPSEMVVALAVTRYKLAASSRTRGETDRSIEYYDAALSLLEGLRDKGQLDAEKESWIDVLAKEREELR